MTERLIGETGSRKRRRFLILPVLVIAFISLFVITAAQAVHDETFQLDGDVVASNPTNIDGKVQAFDWDSLFNADGTTKPDASLPAGFGDANLVRDFRTSTSGSFVTSDGTTFATGSKDILPISGWQCNLDNNVNSKIDVMNAYAATYTAPNDDEILYFGIERNVNTGTANVGFWFLQDQVACESTGAAVTFSGEHQDGDLLIVSEFTGGGTVSTINVYRWDRPNPLQPGSLNPTPVGDGVDCRNTDLAPDDEACGAANRAPITTPWLTSAKTTVGHSLPTALFFEAGLNLTKTGLGGKCFNTFLGDTRSSTSLTATLFDFTGGELGSCETTLTTDASGSSSSINNGSTAANGTASSGIDEANLTIAGVDEWAGSLKFYLCGPIATGVCSAGGVLVSTVSVDETTVQPIPSGNGTTSGIATLTAAGRYCWFAEFTPDADTLAAGVSGATHDGSANDPNLECFSVSPVTPALDTDAGDGPVSFGSAVTDVATLSGAAKEPGNNGASNGGDADYPSINANNGVFVGTIGFTLKGPQGSSPSPANCASADAVAFPGSSPTSFPINRDVTGNTTYNASFTPNAPGYYHWVAVYSYSGTAVNNPLPVTHNGACGDADESVQVQQIPTAIKTQQSWYPNDTATISASSGNLGAGGSVVFSLYNNATCTGVAVYTETESVTGGSPTEVESTSNITYAINTAYADPAASTTGRYSWKVVYTPAASDTAHTGIQSSCAEFFNITYTNDNGPGSALTP